MARSKFSGKARLERVLRKMPDTARTYMKEMLVKSADELIRAQKALAPRRTGALRDSIQWTDDSSKIPSYAAFRQRGIVRDSAYSIFVTAGNSKVRYAHLVEWGTPPHINAGLFPGTQHPGTEPHPFFFAPWRTLKRRIDGRAKRAAAKSVKKALGK